MENIIVIELHGENEILETVQMDLFEYYDGDAYDELIDSKNVLEKGIKCVIATQYDEQGISYAKWLVTFDEQGNVADSEDIFDENE